MTTTMKEPATHYLVATDLDGTLLDHHSYAFDEALPALALCREHHIPVVFNTSKTAAETCRLRARLNNHHPFIVENGSAAYIPVGYFDRMPEGCEELDGYWVKRFGMPLDQILAAMEVIRTEGHFDFVGYSNWDTAEVAAQTGLSMLAAGESRQRAYSEPLIWQDCDVQLHRFRQALQEKGMKLLQGGRFLHVLGDTDKGQPLRWLAAIMEQASGSPLTLVALGDSDNDADMLQAADIAVVVRSPVRAGPKLSGGKQVIHTRAYGPGGWNEAISGLFTPGPE